VRVAVFEFGPFLLDPSTRSLLRDAVPQILAPKTFDLLLVLVEQRARVVSKDELLQTLWPGTFVEEGNLSQQIFLLRKILGGDDQPEYITTVPRRGYRFAVEVTERSEASQTLPRGPRPGQRRSYRLSTALISGVLVAGAASSAYIRWGGSSAETADPRIVSVTSLPGLESSPSISPDGNFVVFSWTGPNPEGIPDLWVSAVDRDSRQRLTETPTAAETSPAWSPDMRDIAFIRVGKGVFVVPALGGPEQKVADSGSMVAWMPDGRSLLVRDGKPGVGIPYGIFQIDRETFKRSQVTRAPGGIGDSAFAVSPDGRSLAFVRNERPGVGDVYIAPIAGGEAHRRTNWNSEISGVAWTRAGRNVVYAVLEEPGLDQTLFRIPAIGNRLDRGVRALHVSAKNPSMSRPPPGESGRLAFTAARVDVALRLIDLQRPLTGDVFQSVHRFADSTRLDVPGPFSKDGGRLAFVSDRNGWVRVWVANRDGSGIQPVTTLKATELVIGSWSRDGQRIVVDAAIDGNSDVYIVYLDGRTPRRLTTEPSVDLLTEWSADERWIFFSSNRSGSLEIWKVPADGGKAEQVTRQGGGQPKLGPDGQTLFYLDRAPPGPGGVSGTSTLKSVRIDGGAEVPVLDGVRLGLWSVTDRGIAFVTIEPESDAIDFYDFGDQKVRRLGRLPFRVSRHAGLGMLHVDRDCRWALVSVTDQWESDIKVADGFR
jgi:Tol biopolymer transport system component/DNA-binding winged helix-turn-helix (wHTH) protein